LNSEAESRRLATVVQDSNDAVLVLDLDGRITNWNAGASRMYGYSKQEAKQMTIFDIVPEQHQGEMRTMLDQIRNGLRVDSFESQRRTKDGRILNVWLTVTALMDYGKRPAYVATTERDLSSGSQQEKDRDALEALRSAEYYKVAEELRAILDATIDAVVTINQQGVMVRVNRVTEKLFGYSQAELIGQNVSMLMTSPDRENHDGYIRRYLETGEARIIGIGREVRCQRKDTSTFFGDLTINAVDHLGLFTGMIRDITERRRLQGEILRAVSEEQRRIGQDLHDTAGQDLAGMAYLIKSHMSILQENIDKAASTDFNREWINNRLATLQKISEAIRDLQKKIRTVIRGLSPVDVNGNGLMAALTDLTAGIRELHHVRCEFQCDPPILIADNQVATHLYRIVQEAINNGVRHGGATEIVVRLETNETDIILTVHDNGCGFNFKQSTENGGFGLHIMAYRANLIGARFSIQPGEHGGTTVSCRLSQVESDAQ
jgi:two-component system sensor kinase FixL